MEQPHSESAALPESSEKEKLPIFRIPRLFVAENIDLPQDQKAEAWRRVAMINLGTQLLVEPHIPWVLRLLNDPSLKSTDPVKARVAVEKLVSIFLPQRPYYTGAGPESLNLPNQLTAILTKDEIIKDAFSQSQTLIDPEKRHRQIRHYQSSQRDREHHLDALSGDQKPKFITVQPEIEIRSLADLEAYEKNFSSITHDVRNLFTKISQLDIIRRLPHLLDDPHRVRRYLTSFNDVTNDLHAKFAMYESQLRGEHPIESIPFSEVVDKFGIKFLIPLHADDNPLGAPFNIRILDSVPEGMQSLQVDNNRQDMDDLISNFTQNKFRSFQRREKDHPERSSEGMNITLIYQLNPSEDYLEIIMIDNGMPLPKKIAESKRFTGESGHGGQGIAMAGQQLIQEAHFEADLIPEPAFEDPHNPGKETGAKITWRLKIKK